MRITYFADIRFPIERANGIQTFETCAALTERGHAVDLIVRPDTTRPARDPFDYYGVIRRDALRIERVPASGPATSRRFGYLAFAAGRAFGRGRADVLMTRDLGVASMLLRLPPAMRPPVVYESHGYAPEVAAALPALVATAVRPSAWKLRRLADREARVWHGANGYVTITAGLAEDLAARLGSRERLAVIPDGARMTRTLEGADFEPPAHPVVAYSGHLYAWKGVDVLLQALALLAGTQGLVVGGHPEEPDLARLKSLAARLGIAERVTFTGIVLPRDVAERLRSAAVLALPNPASAISTRFTSPLKLFEYMAAGRAIVASDLPSIREVLRDGENALLVPPGDAASLATAIQRLLDDRVLAARLAGAAFAAMPEYSWSRRAEKLERLFTEVTNTQSS